MKLLSVLFLFVYVNLYAQLIQDYGIKIGLVNSQMNLTLLEEQFSNLGEPNIFKYNRIGTTFGLFLLMLDNENLNIETEFSYHEEGAQDEVYLRDTENIDKIVSTIYWDHEFNFLRLGLYLRPKYKFSLFNLFLVLGPNINYLTKNATLVYLDEVVSSIHYGYNLGVGITFNNIFHFPLLIEMKYNGYFNDFVNNSKKLVKINSVQLNIGFVLK